jgi:hypothetical protein
MTTDNTIPTTEENTTTTTTDDVEGHGVRFQRPDEPQTDDLGDKRVTHLRADGTDDEDDVEGHSFKY